MIWNYTLDLELFSTMLSIRLGIKKLLDLGRFIGAVPHNKDDKKCIILKLPLPPPVSKVMKRKKKTNSM